MHLGDNHLSVGFDLAKELFEKIGKASFDGTGFTRAAYGEGEQMAHDIVAEVARSLDLDIEIDAALNMSMTLRGRNSGVRVLMIGSHLDAVPSGGNYDGLAGVLSGVACLAALRNSSKQLPYDISVLALRGEESAWFGAQHLGSRALLGTLDQTVFETATRVDSGQTLGFHMREAGVDLSKIGIGKPLRDLGEIAGFVELHIEQGPLLLKADKPVGIVTGIRGNRRCRKIVCTGEYGHSGTVARPDRRDAVFAVSELITKMDALWKVIEEDEGGDMVLTFGRFSTDDSAHSVTTVPGQVEFCFDVRSHSVDILKRTESALVEEMESISKNRNVTFARDAFTGDMPTNMDCGFQQLLKTGCADLKISAMPITSGAGHDAGDFAMAGIRSAMLFIRSENGSHNPNEHIDLGDFNQGTRLISWFAKQLSVGVSQ